MSRAHISYASFTCGLFALLAARTCVALYTSKAVCRICFSPALSGMVTCAIWFPFSGFLPYWQCLYYVLFINCCQVFFFACVSRAVIILDDVGMAIAFFHAEPFFRFVSGRLRPLFEVLY